MNQREQAIATKTYEVYTDKYSCIVQAESIQDALETFAAYYRRDEADEVWSVEDVAMREEDRKSAAALSEPGGEAEPVAWIYEDQLPDGYPYHIMFPYSEVRDGVRMFPVYAPLSADRIMEVVREWDAYCIVSEVDPDGFDDLRSRLSELGLK